MRCLTMAIVSFFSLVFTLPCYAAEQYKIAMPELLGVRTSSNSYFEINVNTEKKFSSVSSARLIIKGKAFNGVWASTEDDKKKYFFPVNFNIAVTTPCKPQLTKRWYPNVDTGPLSGDFALDAKFVFPVESKRNRFGEVRIEHEPDWSFFVDGETIFRFYWFGIPRYDIEKKQVEPCLVNIEEAYLLIEADAYNPALAEKTPPEIPTARILFEHSYANFAWGKVYNGFFIDLDGKIWRFDASCQSLLNPSKDISNDGSISDKDLREKFRYSKLVGQIELPVIQKKASLIAGAAKGQIIRNSRANDMGASGYGAYLYDERSGRYKHITLESRGDWDIVNTSDEAKELTNWLRSIIPMRR